MPGRRDKKPPARVGGGGGGSPAVAVGTIEVLGFGCTDSAIGFVLPCLSQAERERERKKGEFRCAFGSLYGLRRKCRDFDS